MRFMIRFLGIVILIAAAALAGAYFISTRAEAPGVEVLKPTRLIGLQGTIQVRVETPDGLLDSLEIDLEQNGTTVPLFTLTDAPQDSVQQETSERLLITLPYDRGALGGVRPGAASLRVRAVRPVLFGFRQVASEVMRDVELRFEPPRLAVLSTLHYINHGGAEMVVYRVQPPEAESGVQVGNVTYPGYPAAAAGVAGATPAMKVAFFALLHDQDLHTPIAIVARDEAGNEASASFDFRVFPKEFRRSHLEVPASFMRRVVTDITAASEAARSLVENMPEDDLVQRYVRINGDLRRQNAEVIEGLATKTAPSKLWQGPLIQLGNSQVEAGFADHRTYYHEGQEIDRQVHLGFDLAATANVAIRAANDGTVIWADYLGIYGNCVIIDHGMGLQSLYAHLSSIGVSVGSNVRKEREIGRSGMTGLAGGDHLHFTVLLQGRPVSPVEWWDPHWIDDRIMRKLEEAGS